MSSGDVVYNQSLLIHKLYSIYIHTTRGCQIGNLVILLPPAWHTPDNDLILRSATRLIQPVGNALRNRYGQTAWDHNSKYCTTFPSKNMDCVYSITNIDVLSDHHSKMTEDSWFASSIHDTVHPYNSYLRSPQSAYSNRNIYPSRNALTLRL